MEKQGQGKFQSNQYEKIKKKDCIFLLDRLSGKSFIYIINSTGPITLPCGTPEITSFHSEIDSPRTTRWRLLVKNASIQSKILPDMPYLDSFSNNRLCGTLSMAFSKSRKSKSS